MARSSTTRKKGDPALPGAGRRKVAPEVKEALLDLTPHAIERLAQLVDSPDDKVAIVAVREVLDRNMGKPRQTIDVTDMTDEQIRSELRRMVRESGLAEIDEDGDHASDAH